MTFPNESIDGEAKTISAETADVFSAQGALERGASRIPASKARAEKKIATVNLPKLLPT